MIHNRFISHIFLSTKDLIWAIYAYFTWTTPVDKNSMEGLKTAVQGLAKIVGLPSNNESTSLWLEKVEKGGV